MLKNRQAYFKNLAGSRRKIFKVCLTIFQIMHGSYVEDYCVIRKNIFACLFSAHNIISLSRHEQVCLMRLRFERYFSHHQAT